MLLQSLRESFRKWFKVMNQRISRVSYARQKNILAKTINIPNSQDVQIRIHGLLVNDIKKIEFQSFIKHLKYLLEHDDEFDMLLCNRRLGQKLIYNVQSYIRIHDVQFNYIIKNFFCKVALSNFTCDINILERFLFAGSIIDKYYALDIFIYIADLNCGNSSEHVNKNVILKNIITNHAIQVRELNDYQTSQNLSAIYIIIHKFIQNIIETQDWVLLAQKIIMIIIQLIRAQSIKYFHIEFIHMIFDLAKENTKKLASELYYDLLYTEFQKSEGVITTGQWNLAEYNDVNLELILKNHPDLANLSYLITVERQQGYPIIQDTILYFMNVLFSPQTIIDAYVLDNIVAELFKDENLFLLQQLHDQMLPSNSHARQAAQIIKNISFYASSACDQHLMLICVYALHTNISRFIMLLSFNDRIEIMHLLGQYIAFLFKTSVYKCLCSQYKEILEKIFKDLQDIYIYQIQDSDISELQEIFMPQQTENLSFNA